VSEAIKMPSLGQTSDDATIQAWLVAEGDVVEMGDPLLTVETDKATLDVESVADGTVLRIVVAQGETVTAGTVIAHIGEPDEEGGDV
jgi:pyruvate/2-oxoglutarate dehydrogenase complex dihydrolipoamide acyltransferase (E2) component